MIFGIVSGYFNPLHVGHVRYINEAKKRCDWLLAIVNNDFQQILKKGKIIIPEDERLEIVDSLWSVDNVMLSIDQDSTVCETLRKIANTIINRPMVFFNGGDRVEGNTPEREVCQELGIEMVFNLVPQYDSSTRILSRM